MTDKDSSTDTLPAWRYEEIRAIMSSLLCRHNITHFPISGFEIAKRQGIKIVPYSHYSGELRQLYMSASNDGFNVIDHEGQATIYYNDGMPYERINFTILHELAHIILGHREHSALAEKEANFAAGFLIAPPAALALFNPQSPLEVGTICQTSRQASVHSFKRYQSWKRAKSRHPMADYEQMLYSQFAKAKEEHNTRRQ